MAPTFKYPDTVSQAISAARVREPRLHASFIKEIGEEASRMVAHGEWIIDNDGQALNGAGQNVEQWVNAYTVDRPHGEVPAVVVDASDETWTKVDDKGRISLTAQGVRHKVLTTALGSAKAATVAMEAEAALYGTKFGSTTPGTKPGEKKVVGDSDSGSPFNPRKTYTSQEARENEIVKFVRHFGTKTAQAHMTKFSVDMAGRAIRPKPAR
jgi:hypothetical protein